MIRISLSLISLIFREWHFFAIKRHKHMLLNFNFSKLYCCIHSGLHLYVFFPFQTFFFTHRRKNRSVNICLSICAKRRESPWNFWTRVSERFRFLRIHLSLLCSTLFAHWHVLAVAREKTQLSFYQQVNVGQWLTQGFLTPVPEGKCFHRIYYWVTSLF